jgi:hypothetical protein
MARINNKEERQKIKKDIHRQQKQNKRDELPNLERQAPILLEAAKILIVCEGKNTEKSYFEQFRRVLRYSNITIEVIPAPTGIKPRGTDPKTIVAKAKKIQVSEKQKGTPFTKVWCVFDHDPLPSNPKKSVNFNNYIKKAESLGFGVAYSNQAFEYWLLLHFENHLGSLHRSSYYDKINGYLNLLGLVYDKDSKLISEEIFETLQVVIDAKTGKTRQDLAIERAESILNKWKDEDPSRANPAKEESSTTVFQLVEELIKYKS